MRIQRTLFLLFVAALGACQSAGYRIVEPPQNNHRYTQRLFSMSVQGYDNQRCEASVHTKILKISGNLGVCGYILNAGEIGCGDGYLTQSLTNEVFSNATVLIDGEAVSKAGYMTLRDFGTTEDNVAPTCVRMEQAWRNQFHYARVTFKYAGFNEVTE